MLRTLIIRAERGRVMETMVVDESLEEVVKRYAFNALKEWDPAHSYFVVMRDDSEVDVEGPIDEDILKALREKGFLVENKGSPRAKLPVYTISFDNRVLGEDVYIENKIYLMTFYVTDDLKMLFEAEAANITAQEEEPREIRDQED